jgi:D-alanine-D-alanine ligase
VVLDDGDPDMTAPDPRIRVAVVYGGRSSEHGISTVSAGSVLGALDPAKYDVLTVGITRDGQWVLTDAHHERMAIADGTLPEVVGDKSAAGSDDSAPSTQASPATAEAPNSSGVMAVDSSTAVRALGGVDVVFPVLHGRFGEDGTIQGLLEMADVAYVGAGVFASAAAMDKEYTKKLLRAEGLDVGRYVVLRRGDAVAPDLLDELSLPVFVKPARAGSSVGITKVRTAGELPSAIEEAFEHDTKVLIEAGVVGREVECGVLEWPDGSVRASLPAEIRLVRGHDWYDFDAKYLDDACEFDLPATLSPEVTARVQELAVSAFRALDGAGLARVDFFVPEHGDPIVNEINTMPGFTPISMYPRMWAASGLPYPELLDILIATARTRPR